MDPLWFDVVVAAILLYAVIRGAMQGLVWQLAAIAAIVLSFAFSETVSILVAPAIDLEPPLNRWVAMLGLYLLATLVCFAIAWTIHDALDKWKLKHVDRQLGAAFGFLKGATFALVALFFIVTLSESARKVALRSHSGLAAAVVMEQLHPVMPDELHDIIHPYIHQLDDAKHMHAHDDDSRAHHHDSHSHDSHSDTDHDSHSHPAGDSHDDADTESLLRLDHLLPEADRSIFDRGVLFDIPPPFNNPEPDGDSPLDSPRDPEFDPEFELEFQAGGAEKSGAQKSAARPAAPRRK